MSVKTQEWVNSFDVSPYLDTLVNNKYRPLCDTRTGLVLSGQSTTACYRGSIELTGKFYLEFQN